MGLFARTWPLYLAGLAVPVRCHDQVVVVAANFTLSPIFIVCIDLELGKDIIPSVGICQIANDRHYFPLMWSIARQYAYVSFVIDDI